MYRKIRCNGEYKKFKILQKISKLNKVLKK